MPGRQEGRMQPTIADVAVAEVFAAHPPAVRDRLLALRSLILDTAANTRGVGPVAETLKWGQISYLTPESRSGTTIRIDARADGVAMFVNCQTNLVERYRAAYPQAFRYDGDRALLLDDKVAIDEAALRHCIAMALTYHLAKRRK
jgi:hypothetical protein